MPFPSVGSLRKNNWDQSADTHPSMHLVAVIVADSSSVAVSWGIVQICYGDVESNPGPCNPNENTMYCIICSAKKLSIYIQTDMQRKIFTNIY